MADVRALLRNERAARRIEHPHASYTTGGSLFCQVCDLHVKAESLWELHTRSALHIKNLKSPQRTLPTAQEGARSESSDLPSRPIEGGTSGRKRKAEETHDEDPTSRVDSRKKSRAISDSAPTTLVAEQTKQMAPPNSQMSQEKAKGLSSLKKAESMEERGATEEVNGAEVDEAEWAAFERDVVASPPPDALAAVTAAATITAAPMSAADIAAQAREEASVQAKDLKAIEAEEEREEAARQLDEEFEQMEALEERLKRLKERREALRKDNETSGEPAKTTDDTVLELDPGGEPIGGELGRETQGNVDNDSDDDYDDEDDFDNWGR